MNFNDLVKYILKEAPITDVVLDSDIAPFRNKINPTAGLNKNSQIAKNKKADFALIRSKRYRDRLQAETARNIPFNIKLIFIDTEDDYENERDYRPTPGVITLVTMPTGDPMILSQGRKGVWMVGHKLGHALDSYFNIFSDIKMYFEKNYHIHLGERDNIYGR